MPKFYVSGKYRGVDVGVEVTSSNQWEAAIDFVPKIVELLNGDGPISLSCERKKMTIEGVEEVSDNLKTKRGEINDK
ncbi:hypothetical protein Javan174_0017 [Streptococcus phage Javan174]|uniref:hypothetical protein n=1 Tax=Streptococcus entericus TaxID=155680 RepID=UPI00037D9438|nr:hypothetical protein [Streptococcus entericus]QBX24083.1 hypothetical protein Javan174_0017 [Streptococcus phage Javan174]